MSDHHDRVLDWSEEEFRKTLKAELREAEAGDTKSDLGYALFLQSIERRAREEDTNPETIMQRDLEGMIESQYPGPECLTPSEVETYVNAELSVARVEHLDQCPECRSMVEAAEPDLAGWSKVWDILLREKGKLARDLSIEHGELRRVSLADFVDLTAGAVVEMKEQYEDPLVAVGPDEPLRGVLEIMEERDYSGVPVLHNEKLLGCVRRDAVTKALLRGSPASVRLRDTDMIKQEGFAIFHASTAMSVVIQAMYDTDCVLVRKRGKVRGLLSAHDVIRLTTAG